MYLLNIPKIDIDANEHETIIFKEKKSADEYRDAVIAALNVFDIAVEIEDPRELKDGARIE